jgi:hypothetical protein
MAADMTGDAYVSTGGSWSTAGQLPGAAAAKASHGGGGGQVSCASASFCVLLGANGDAWIYS